MMIESRLWRARKLRKIIRELCPDIASPIDCALPDIDRVSRIMESPVSEVELFSAFHTVRCFSRTMQRESDELLQRD